MNKNVFARFDYAMILIVLSLISIGVMFIYSSSVNSLGVSVTNEYVKQIIWAGVGLVLMSVLTIYDYRKTQYYNKILFIAINIILIYTPFFGRTVNGAKSWLGIGQFGIQPSELGKVIFILYLANYLETSQDEHPLKRFVHAGIILAIPVLLILLQPDLGTSSVYIPIFLVMCFIAGIPVRFILYVLFLGLFTIYFDILPVWNSEIAQNPVTVISILTDFKLRFILTLATLLITLIGIIVLRYFHGPRYFYWISYVFSILTLALIFSLAMGKVLKDYQVKRLIIFIDPYVDRLGAGWNIIQSKVAIGAGGLYGQGYLQGTQSHYRFLPQQSTDFIFSILSEEWGFVRCLLVFGLYFLIFVKLLYLIRKCVNKYGTYIAAGILGMFSYHFFINVGMVMGIMPITGIPLLFLSYGGSSLLTAMICMGLYMSINSRRNDLK